MTKCDCVECDREQTYRMDLLIWPKGSPKMAAAALRVELHIWLCQQHAMASKPADLITEEGFKAIRDSIVESGLPEPDRSSMELDAIPYRLN